MRKFLSLVVLLVMAITATAKDVRILVKSDATPYLYAWYYDNGNKVEITGTEPGLRLSETVTIKNPKSGNNETFYTTVLSYEGEDGVSLKFVDGDQKTQDFNNLKGFVHYFYFYGSNNGNMDNDFSSTTSYTYTVVGAYNGTAAGQSDILFGTAWEPANVNNDMIEGVKYYLTKNDITVENNNVQYKVAVNHAWTESYPTQNMSLSSKLPENGGTFDFNFYFDPITKVVDATVTQDVKISNALYATYAFDGKTDYANANTNLKAYRVQVEDGKANLYPVEGTLPVNTPVVLKAEEAGTYTVYAYNISDQTTVISNNDLRESDGTVEGNGATIYSLAKKSAGIGFYLVEKGVTVPNGRCYLEIPASGGNAKAFLALGDGETTGINSFKAESVESSAIYNLQGIQVDENYKGIIIKNGKKYINK